MPTTTNKDGQKITTSYEPKTAASKEALQHHADRRDQNRQKREEATGNKSYTTGQYKAIQERDNAPASARGAPPRRQDPGLTFSGIGAAIMGGAQKLRNLPAPSWIQGNQSRGKGKKGSGSSAPAWMDGGGGGGLPSWFNYNQTPPAWTGLNPPTTQRATKKKKTRHARTAPIDNRPPWIRW